MGLVLALVVVGVMGKMRLDAQRQDSAHPSYGRSGTVVVVQPWQAVRMHPDGKGFDIVDQATDEPVPYDVEDQATGEVTRVTPID